MNKRLISVLAFGVIVAAIASVVLYRLISARLVASASPKTTQVVVATHGLAIGTLIKDIDVKLTSWSGPVPQGATSSPQEIVGRGVIAAIIEGEPVVDSRLAPKGAGAGLAATIPPGMRAVAVSVNEVVGVAGFVVPGMRVDVLISGNPPGARTAVTGTQARTLLQNIEVLSAGQNIQKDAEGKPMPVQVVNLLVTPEQAEILSLATQETRIRLVLRNPLDTDVAKTPGTALANLFGADVKPAQQPAQVSHARRAPVVRPVVEVKPPQKVVVPIVVEVINGTHRTEAKFKPESEKAESEAIQ
jgi:pilus assembly protein CpaB